MMGKKKSRRYVPPRTCYLIGLVDTVSGRFTQMSIASEYPVSQMGTSNYQVLVTTALGRNYHNAEREMLRLLHESPRLQWTRQFWSAPLCRQMIERGERPC